MMPRSQKVAVGCLTCGALGLSAVAAVARVAAAMRRECVVYSNVGDGLGLLIAAPFILVGTGVAAGVVFALTVLLVKRDWSVYVAIGAAVFVAAAAVPVGVGHVYEPDPSSGLCENGIPDWWPFHISLDRRP